MRFLLKLNWIKLNRQANFTKYFYIQFKSSSSQVNRHYSIKIKCNPYEICKTQPFCIFSSADRGLLRLTSGGNLGLADVGQNVVIRGFLQFVRMDRFIILRDSFGSIQAVLDNKNELLQDIPYESYLEVSGTVSARPENQVNPKMKTGEIEISAAQMIVINKANNLPFLIREHNKAKESLGLKYRYLALRQAHLQTNLRLRSFVNKKMRDYLQDINNFTEITTPTLSRNTPGGAQEFVVPTQLKDLFYSLVQSPQIFKQLAVIGGFEKYFQFAICYRDEGARPDRQPEFMQLDIEMANASMYDVMELTEGIIHHSWPIHLPNLTDHSFPHMHYSDAIENYGVDKPDIRYDWKLVDLSHIMLKSASSIFSSNVAIEGNICKALLIPNGKMHMTRKYLETWNKIAELENKLQGISVWSINEGSLKGPLVKSLGKETEQLIITKLNIMPEDLVVVAAGPRMNVLNCLGKLRILGADFLESLKIKVRSDTFKFVWIINFPLFEIDEESGKLVSCHHPFTAPIEEDMSLLCTQPEKVISQHYDLVLNGTEIAGGSIRIHNPKVQSYILNEILNIDSKDLNFLLKALECGAPPHGGIALGFDRYLSILLGCESIRDVIAFPKSSDGKCQMSESPSVLPHLNILRFTLCAEFDKVGKIKHQCKQNWNSRK